MCIIVIQDMIWGSDIMLVDDYDLIFLIYLHIAVGNLVVSLVGFHVQGHVASSTFETCFVPRLENKTAKLYIKHT